MQTAPITPAPPGPRTTHPTNALQESRPHMQQRPRGDDGGGEWGGRGKKGNSGPPRLPRMSLPQADQYQESLKALTLTICDDVDVKLGCFLTPQLKNTACECYQTLCFVFWGFFLFSLQ